MRRAEIVVASAFLALGVYLIAASFGFPAGMGRLPGPGFFPRIIGAVTALLAGGLLWTAVRGGAGEDVSFGGRRALVITVGMLTVYLLLWGVIPFPVRTIAFVTLFLRLVGERWVRAAVVAVVLTAAVTAAFQYGLRVSLG